jgi:hypothetical protein
MREVPTPGKTTQYRLPTVFWGFTPITINSISTIIRVMANWSWKRKVQIDSKTEQARITLPKKWVESNSIEDKEELSVELSDDMESLVVKKEEK